MTVDATEHTARSVERYLRASTFARETPGELLMWWKFRFSVLDHNGFKVLTVGSEYIEVLCTLAVTDPAARTVARKVISSKLLANYPLNHREAHLAGQMLADTLPPVEQSRTGPKLAKNFDRNVFITLLARDLKKKYCLEFTRNDEPKSPRTSAADIISWAFVENKRHEVTYRSVKEVLMNQKLRRDVDFLSDTILLVLAT